MSETDKKNIPAHVGLIIDGNRRWARERNLPSLKGHAQGFQKIKQATDWFFAAGVKILSLYVFSTENWNRSAEEVNYLMKLISQRLAENLKDFIDKEYQVMFSGRLNDLPGDLPQICADLETKTKKYTKGTINICLNYGGRAEMIDAVKKMIKNNISAEQVHEGMMRKYFYQPDLPDPDIIIRTAGEYRLSNFLLWQSAYSELMFLQKFWPDFEKSDVDKIIAEYNKRERRFGV